MNMPWREYGTSLELFIRYYAFGLLDGNIPWVYDLVLFGLILGFLSFNSSSSFLFLTLLLFMTSFRFRIA